MFIVLSKSFLIFDEDDVISTQNDGNRQKALIVYDLKQDSSKSIQIDWCPSPEMVKNDSGDVKKNSKEPIVSFNTGTVSNLQDFIAISDDLKNVIIFDRNFKKINQFKIKKNAQKMIFTKNEDKILICDKAGDIYEFDVKQSTITTSDEENCGRLLLGHCSMLLDFLLTDDQRYIISADRDEKIRVTHYPNTYNIKTYCLGHTQFVSVIQLINEQTLASGSGDGKIKIWNYLNGKILYTHDFHEQQPQQPTSTTTNGGNKSLVRSDFAIKSMTIDRQNNGRHLCVSFLNQLILYLFKIEYQNDDEKQFKSLNIITQLKLNQIPLMIKFDSSHINFLWIFGATTMKDDDDNNNEPIQLYEMKQNELARPLIRINVIDTLNQNEHFRRSVAAIKRDQYEYLFKHPFHGEMVDENFQHKRSRIKSE